MDQRIARTFFFLVFIVACLQVGRGTNPLMESAIVKITVTKKTPNYFEPWLMLQQSTASGSGCIIAGNRILTSAHVVADQVFIQVQRNGDPSKYTALVESVSHDCDLAVIKPTDASFFQGTRPILLGEIPPLSSQITVFGFPQGGEKMSVTAGVVSRIEIGEYVHSGLDFLRLQIDAAINPGNSGGPVMSGERMVGIAFSANRSNENVGYAVPIPIINHFLTDIADGRVQGMPHLGVTTQKIESPALRQSLQLDPGCNGIRIIDVAHGSSAWGVLRENDVILAIAGSPVACDGTVNVDKIGEVEFIQRIHQSQIGESIPLTLLRDGHRLSVSVKLGGYRALVPKDRYDIRPTYFIMAGLIFQPLTADYLYWFDYADIPAEFIYVQKRGKQNERKTEVVFLSKVLPHAVNIGYHEIHDELVTAVNGQPVGSMRDMIAAFGAPQGKYHIVQLGDGTRIVLSAEESLRASPDILNRFQIPSDRSADLQ